MCFVAIDIFTHQASSLAWRCTWTKCIGHIVKLRHFRASIYDNSDV